jgi:hypothetical protein
MTMTVYHDKPVIGFSACVRVRSMHSPAQRHCQFHYGADVCRKFKTVAVTDDDCGVIE